MKTMLDIDKLVFSPPDLGCSLYLTGLPGGGSKIHDRSPYGNHGTVTGAVWKRLPSGLWCLNFDGSDDYVDCGSDNSLEIGTNGWSVNVWLKVPSDSNYRVILNSMVVFATNSSKGYYLYLGNDDTRVSWGVSDGTTRIQNYVVSPITLKDNTWHHIVATFNSTTDTVKLYVDTTEIGSDTSGTPLGTIINDRQPEFGRDYGSGSPRYYFLGLLALPRVYNRALSALEIQNCFNQEKHLFGVW